ncbi:hypothetical protein HJC23_001783 [Cyclotella cryptica]|uniref:Uracil-DNA glycosylase n=1 Tax=Cyclotella cryptica TaxID=29204 RepID=A0ABD3QPD0_9STRA
MITSFFAPKKKRARPAEEDSDNIHKRASTTSTSTPSITTPSPSSSSSAAAPSAIISPSASAESRSKASALLRHFPDSNHDVSWRRALKATLESKKFEALAHFVEKERATKTVYPPPELVFSALARTPLHKVKVVIVGQDPYHQPNQSHGLSFSVPRSIPIPPSLRNIYKELLSDPLVDFNSIPTHGNLERWASQGVLLLNNVLTVRKGEPATHSKRGWEEFTDAVIRAVVERHDDKTTTVQSQDFDDTQEERGRGVVFLLWGKPASVKAQTVLAKYARGKSQQHAIITCSHPSPLGATKTDKPFMQSKCFSRANEELTKRGWAPVDWRVDGDL